MLDLSKTFTHDYHNNAMKHKTVINVSFCFRMINFYGTPSFAENNVWVFWFSKKSIRKKKGSMALLCKFFFILG